MVVHMLLQKISILLLSLIFAALSTSVSFTLGGGGGGGVLAPFPNVPLSQTAAGNRAYTPPKQKSPLKIAVELRTFP